jgi:hypothetical protein
MKLSLGLLLAIMVSGCTAWRRDDSVLHTTIPQRRPVQVWSQGRALEAHGLEVRSDSLRAVPRWKPPECDSCARFYAVGEVDSLRVRSVSQGRTVSFAILVAVGVLLLQLKRQLAT